jgi:hypothetical protein
MPTRAADQNPSSGKNESTIAALRQRRGRLRLWLFIFIALMPVGCIGPFGLLMVVPDGTPKTVLGILMLGLPFVGLGGMLLMLGDQSKAKRALALAEQAEEMGLLFTEKPKKGEYDWVRELKMYGNADDRARASNQLTGDNSGIDVTILDYSYVVGIGKYAQVYSQTLFVLHDVAQGLPDFILYPRGWLEALSALFGDRLIELRDHPGFSKRFAVQGDDAEAIRECLGEAAVQLCERYKDLTIEISEGLLAMHRHKRLAAANDYPEIVAYLGSLVKALEAG